MFLFRCATRRTGACWQRGTVQALTKGGADRPRALAGMLRGYVEQSPPLDSPGAWTRTPRGVEIVLRGFDLPDPDGHGGPERVRVPS